MIANVAKTRAQRLLAGQNRALELIACNAPLPEILEFVTGFVESQATDLRCSVLLLEGGRLRHGAAPSLPAEYIQAIDGVEIGPSVGSCGTAAFTAQTVVVVDIDVDPLWANGRDLALSHGLRACWSTPILSSRGAVLGTFAMYYPYPGPPRDDDWHLVKVATHLAGIAIERFRTDEELRRQSEQLKEANRAKDQFLATLSHELRNPLAPLLAATELIRLRTTDPVSVERYRAVIERQARQLSHLVDDLLDIARITRGMITLSKQLVSVATLIAAAQETSAELIGERRHELVIHLPSEPLEVYADSSRMIQVLSNVINNAAKYTEPGGRIAISAARVGDEIVIRVSDSGHGIEKELLSQVFEPFVQIERLLDRSQGGLGVGLSLVRSLVELHGGQVEAQSEGLGKGSEVMIRVPAPAAPALKPDPPPEATTPVHRRVLVVDDNVDAAELVGEFMSLMGHEVRLVHDGPAALAAVEAWHPDVVFLDIGLPGMDGYEVARRVRLVHPKSELRLIALTGYGQPADILHCEAAGMNAHFVKPVDLAKLARAVDEG